LVQPQPPPPEHLSHAVQQHLQPSNTNNNNTFVDHPHYPHYAYSHRDSSTSSSSSSSFFLLNYTNFNHGSFGACPQPVLDYQSMLRRQQEQQPDPFIRTVYKQLWNDTRVRIANSWRVPYREVVLIESASTAMNSILRSIEWEVGVRTVRLG
jgi:hypothetical protein